MRTVTRPTLCVVVAIAGGTLAARLSGALDRGLAASIAELLRRHEPLRRVYLEGSQLHSLDPVGALVLGQALVERHRAGVHVVLLGMPAALRRSLRHHPLSAFLEGDDGIFRDPDLEPFELPASRH
ncbi:MAG TPA: STAS domain-containing protein [Longimicrobiales bacterium]|nr:STAS domain-containing protein [Longimicrobiales bacterium]